MYLARFSYDVAPANRERAHKTMRQELAAARKKGLHGLDVAEVAADLTRLRGAAVAAMVKHFGITGMRKGERMAVDGRHALERNARGREGLLHVRATIRGRIEVDEVGAHSMK